MVYLIKDGEEMRLSEIDEHVLGLFPKSVRLDLVLSRLPGSQTAILSTASWRKGAHWMFMGIKPEVLWMLRGAITPPSTQTVYRCKGQVLEADEWLAAFWIQLQDAFDQ